MNSAQKNEANRLAEEHWNWLATVLHELTGVGNPTLLRVLYTSAFIHGYKHALRIRNGKGQFVRIKEE